MHVVPVVYWAHEHPRCGPPPLPAQWRSRLEDNQSTAAAVEPTVFRLLLALRIVGM